MKTVLKIWLIASLLWIFEGSAAAFISGFHTDPIPKPIAMMLLGVGLIALVFSRKLKK